MKRKILLGIGLSMSIIIFFLGSQTIINPQQYIGTWYAAETGEKYHFEEGIIRSGKEEIQNTYHNNVGAYIFCKDYILLFSQNVIGLEELKQLYLEQNNTILCENQNGSGQIYFFRSREEAISYKKGTPR